MLNIESKKTKAWSDGWIIKLKQDMLSRFHDVRGNAYKSFAIGLYFIGIMNESMGYHVQRGNQRMP